MIYLAIAFHVHTTATLVPVLIIALNVNMDTLLAMDYV
jgi:hypothetical protein